MRRPGPGDRKAYNNAVNRPAGKGAIAMTIGNGVKYGVVPDAWEEAAAELGKHADNLATAIRRMAGRWWRWLWEGTLIELWKELRRRDPNVLGETNFYRAFRALLKGGLLVKNDDDSFSIDKRSFREGSVEVDDTVTHEDDCASHGNIRTTYISNNSHNFDDCEGRDMGNSKHKAGELSIGENRAMENPTSKPAISRTDNAPFFGTPRYFYRENPVAHIRCAHAGGRPSTVGSNPPRGKPETTRQPKADRCAEAPEGAHTAPNREPTKLGSAEARNDPRRPQLPMSSTNPNGRTHPGCDGGQPPNQDARVRKSGDHAGQCGDDAKRWGARIPAPALSAKELDEVDAKIAADEVALIERRRARAALIETRKAEAAKARRAVAIRPTWPAGSSEATRENEGARPDGRTAPQPARVDEPTRPPRSRAVLAAAEHAHPTAQALTIEAETEPTRKGPPPPRKVAGRDAFARPTPEDLVAYERLAREERELARKNGHPFGNTRKSSAVPHGRRDVWGNRTLEEIEADRAGDIFKERRTTRSGQAAPLPIPRGPGPEWGNRLRALVQTVGERWDYRVSRNLEFSGGRHSRLYEASKRTDDETWATTVATMLERSDPPGSICDYLGAMLERRGKEAAKKRADRDAALASLGPSLNAPSGAAKRAALSALEGMRRVKSRLAAGSKKCNSETAHGNRKEGN